MKRYIFVILLQIISALAIDSNAQGKYHFIHFSKSDDDMSYDGVKTLLEDSNGFIWMGTYKGLSRFDGTRFRNYDRDDWNLDTDSIISLAEDAEGIIWIGTEDGVVLYDYRKDLFVAQKGAGAPDDRVFSIIKGQDGEMWIGSRSGLFLWDGTKRNFRKLDSDMVAGFPSEFVYRLAVGRDGKVYMAVYCDDVYVFDVAGKRILPLAGGYFNEDNIEGLTFSEDNPSILYVASKRNGLCSVNLHTGEVEKLITVPNDRRPMFLSSSGHYVWYSTTGGVFRYNPSTGDITHICNDSADPFSLSDNSVTNAVMDASGGLWISTENGGVNYSSVSMDRFERIFSLTSGESLRGAYVKSMAQDSKGVVWIGTENMGILTYNPQSGQLLKYWNAKPLPGDVNAICSDKDFIWIGSHGGICRINVVTSEIKDYTQIFGSGANSDNRVISIYRSYEGVLYVGTNIGVSRYDEVQDCFEKIEGLGGVVVENMVQDSQGRIWMATYSQGVYVYDPNRNTTEFYCQKDTGSVVPEMISSMCMDLKGNIWAIGFSSGFFRYNGTDFDVFSRDNLPTLSTDVYYMALPDNAGRLWLSSDDGLVCYNPINNKVKRFTRADGLLSNKFKKSALLLRDSRMMFGCDDGIILFDPAIAGGGSPALAATISDFFINGERGTGMGNIDCLDKVILSPKDRNISFSFAFPGFPSGADCSILCKLAGYEEQWRDVTVSKTADYYNLPKGTYTLQISTVLDNGTMTSIHPPIKIVRKPSFFESALGISLSVLLVLLFAFTLFYSIYKNALDAQKKKHKEAEKALQEELYHEKMSFFADVIHELKTPLTIIKTPLQNLMKSNDMSSEQKGDVELIGNNADYLSRLVKELLEFITVEEHGYVLEFHNIDINERFGFICSNYYEVSKSHNIRLSFSASEEKIICAVDTKALSKIVNNLLGNAVKYAATYVDVGVSVVSGNLVVSFKNDGEPIPEDRREKIFSPFVHFGIGKFGDQSFGIGLPLAKKLAELHGGSLVLSQSDSYTEFVLTLPLKTVAEDSPDSSVDDLSIEEAEGKTNKPIVLIVEDNPDLLSYLKRKLAPDYKVLGAVSAESALTKMGKYKIDLLITDIGLKAMSGVELCTRMNNTPEYAHIPIIVLSAITTLQTKIQCMQNGASMYIEKPFSLDYLVSCIDSVFEKRKFMKNAYSHTAVKEHNVDLPNRDEDFIRRLDELVTANIADPGFTNKQIEKSLFVSHSSLNRKMKALLGTTANDYIRTKRLRLAARMLERGGVRVGEVCYAVGFNSPSYFAKCFKAEYGELPAEYAKEKKVLQYED